MISIRVLVCSVVILLLTQLAYAQEVSKEYQEQRKKLAMPWKEMFGEKINFLEKDRRNLFNSMIVAGVWSLEGFKDISNNVRRRQWLRDRSSEWMKVFFKKNYRPRVEPLKYYLQKGSEHSTLYYQWKAEKYQFTMFETVAGIMLEITDQKGKAIRPNQDEFSKLMESILNINDKKNDIAKQFQLDGKINEGHVFTNLPNLKSPNYSDWKKSIIVFGSKRGLCILLLKANPGRASVNLPENPDWLTEGLVFPKEE